MRLLKFFLFILFSPLPLLSQVIWVGGSFFPADREFAEIKAVQKEHTSKNPAEFAKFEHGAILLESGLKSFVERQYAIGAPGKLEIAIYSFNDSRSAYSWFSLMAKSARKTGPPGDFTSTSDHDLLFVAGKHYVRIRSNDVGDLPQRVAISVSNRISSPPTKAPQLIRHLPQKGCDLASIHYFIGPRALHTFGEKIAGMPFHLPSEVEAAQARYQTQDGAGLYTIFNFNTIQMAVDYFNSNPLYEKSITKGSRLFTRQTGPLVGMLEGNFSPEVADKILGELTFSYTIKWIYDKKNQSRVVWGVPVKIMSTVVRSIFFTLILGLASIVLGFALGVTRVIMRSRWGHLSKSDSFIRLNLDEN